MSPSEREKGPSWLLGVLLGVLLLAIGGGVFFVWLEEAGPPRLLRPREEGGPRPLPPAGRDSVLLFFATKDGSGLEPEERALLRVATVREALRQTVQELIDGPRRGLQETLPKGTRLLDLFLDDRGTVFLDFDKALSEDHPKGVWAEILTVSSLVQTLTANFDLVKGVQILIEGKPAETLAGHVDLGRPLTRAATEMAVKRPPS